MRSRDEVMISYGLQTATQAKTIDESQVLEKIAEIRRKDDQVVHRIQGHCVVVVMESDGHYGTECIGCGEQRFGHDEGAALWRWEHAASPCRSTWNAEAQIDEIKTRHLNTDDEGEEITLKSVQGKILEVQDQILENQRKLDAKLDKIIRRLGIW